MKDHYDDSLELKIFLIYHLLLSIRMDFSEESALAERHSLALKLTELAIDECKGRAKWFESWLESKGISASSDADDHAAKAKKLEELKKTIEAFNPFETDGRYFRDDFPHGYIGMLECFGMEETK